MMSKLQQIDNDIHINDSIDYRANKTSNNDAFEDNNLDSGNIVQVVNIAPIATLEQLTTLFSFLGDIVNIELYQSNPNSESNFKVCFVEFSNPSSVLIAQHLTNTVFLDRALTVLPYNKCQIPDRDAAISSIEGAEILTNFNYGVVSQITTSAAGIQVIATIDPRLTALGLPQYPHLPINTDPVRVEEIRRTVYVGNLDSTVPPNQVLKFFNDIGEVKYIRMAGDDTQPTRFAFVEYTHQSSIINAIQHTGSVLGSRSLKISHSNNAIVKPQLKIEVESRSKSRDFGSRDIKHQSSSYDRDRERVRNHDVDRYNDRSVSPKDSTSHRSRSRDIELTRRRSRSPRRSRSREKTSRRRSRSKDSRRRRSKSRSRERFRPSRHHKSSRR